jgi:hypothetical protein
MTYYPGGDPEGPADGHPGSIFAVAHDWQMYVSEISIPVPVISSTKSPDDLNTATTLQEFHDVRAGLFDPLVEIIRVGMEYLPAQGGQTSDKLYFAWGQHNQGDGSPELIPSHIWCELNLPNPDTAGSWWVGDCPTSISIYSVNDYMFEIPDDWAAANTPGNLLATGRFRDGGWSGQGPSIYAIGPWNDGNPPAPDTRLNATTLLHYDSSYIEEGHTMSDYLSEPKGQEIAGMGAQTELMSLHGLTIATGAGGPPALKGKSSFTTLRIYLLLPMALGNPMSPSHTPC